jgi:FtsP/CotA-like multicopper oxidase with cupredoxin domain
MKGGICAVLVLLAPIGVSAQAMPGMPGMGGDDPLLVASGRSIVAMMRHPMMPGLEGVRPSGATFVPGEGGAPASTLAEAAASQERRVADGDTVTLEATLVRRTIGGHTIAMYAFNGQAPGPLLRVRQGATIFVRFHNATDRPATIHWHGVRVANRYDGSPDATQPPLAPGASFVYAVHCPDAGIFWYHDHVREDIGQPMGLYGNLIVDPPTPSGSAATRIVPLILGDLLLDGDSVVPFGADAPNFALMGRFGNVVLVNGDPHWQLTVATGEVVRLLLTNASSARTYNVSVGTAPMKLIASDQGAYLHEVMVPSIVIAPGERYVVDVRFDRPGDVALVNEVQTIDHFLGEFIPQVDTLGHVLVAGPARPAAAASSAAAFAVLHEDSAAARDVARFRPEFDRAPDEEIVLTTAITDLPIPVMQFMSVDTLFRPALEWTDGMSDMNWVATGREVRWIIRDRRSGLEDMAINWHFHQGSVIKIRVFNDPRSLHPMDHPLHLHGQRFLVVARDGTPNPYLVWKDTAIIPVGSTVDLLVDLSNPGTWMLHCHIGEHLAAGMMAALTVDPNLGATQ